MASFYCTLSPVDGDGTQLSVYARFTGGASDYTYKRSIDIRITGIGTFSFDSSEVGGGTSTFVGTITGLSPGTTYEWICNMYYWGGSWIVSDYSDSGTATTYSGGGSGGSAKAVVNVGTYAYPNWKRYRAIVNIGGDPLLLDFPGIALPDKREGQVPAKWTQGPAGAAPIRGGHQPTVEERKETERVFGLSMDELQAEMDRIYRD